MNPFMLPEKERLLSWRELRNLIQQNPQEIGLDELVRWWAKAPICRYSIDAYDCSEWPTPWELLNEGMFCTSGVAYMMAMTLIHAGYDPSRIILPFIRGEDDERLVVLLDKTIVLNYSYGEVFEWDEIRKDFTVQHTIRFTGDELKPEYQFGAKM